MSTFDPNGAASPDAGIFGLPCAAADAEVWLLPVPFAATVSYGGGAERGPEAIRAASVQVDLQDLQTGRPFERGIWMDEAQPGRGGERRDCTAPGGAGGCSGGAGR